MDQQPGKFSIMSITGIIGCITFLSFLRKSVHSPDDIEFYLRSNGPILKKLRNTCFVNRMNYPVYQADQYLQAIFAGGHLYRYIHKVLYMLPSDAYGHQVFFCHHPDFPARKASSRDGTSPNNHHTSNRHNISGSDQIPSQHILFHADRLLPVYIHLANKWQNFVRRLFSDRFLHFLYGPSSSKNHHILCPTFC